MKHCFLALILTLSGIQNAFCHQPKEALQKYPVESLSVHISDNGKYAWVYDPTGYVHNVPIRSRIGKNFGLVRKINRCGLWFQEFYPLESFDDWAVINRVLLVEDAPKNCIKNIPKTTIPVDIKLSDLVDRDAIKTSAAADMTKVDGFTLAGIMVTRGEDNWVVIGWDSTSSNRLRHLVYTYDLYGTLLLTNGSEPISRLPREAD